MFDAKYILLLGSFQAIGAKCLRGKVSVSHANMIYLGSHTLNENV
jgi:hypothetical protein